MLARLAVPLLAPLAHAWIRARERVVLREGAPLDPAGVALARRVGVTAPERVRVAHVAAVPWPAPAWIRRVSERMGWAPAGVVGIALGHGVALAEDALRDPREHARLLAHELAHVAQWERLGPRAFVAAYLREALEHGYPNGPLEREARAAEQSARS